MDKFEQYLKENRLGLDSVDFDNASWKPIEESFRKIRRKRNLQLVLSVSGVAALLVLSLWLFIGQPNKNSSNGFSSEQGILAAFSGDLAKQEATYIQLVNQSLEAVRLQRYPAEYEYLFADFLQQLKIIDQQYQIYKTQVEQYGYSPELIQQIIYNYQLKLSVLQMLQSEVSKINKLSKPEKDENSSPKINI